MKTQWDLPESPENLYCVGQKQWAKWPNAARMLFNQTMYATYDRIATLPAVAIDPPDRWRVIRWNIACVAADNLARMLKAARAPSKEKRRPSCLIPYSFSPESKLSEERKKEIVEWIESLDNRSLGLLEDLVQDTHDATELFCLDDD
jgi:hypothetical protein